MKIKNLVAGATGLLMSAMVGLSHAMPILSLDPVEPKVNVGEVFTVNLLWDASAGGEVVSVWDVDIMVNQSIIDYVLGGSGSGGFLGSSVWIGTDQVGIAGQYESSNEDPFDLKTLQDAAGNTAVLGTFQFMALKAGRTGLGINVNELTDEFGQPLSVQTRDGQAAVVPAPGVLWLMVLGLLGMVVSCRKK